MIDRGPMSANERYVVDLGQIDLGRIGTEVFNIAGLPNAEFTAGFVVSDRSKDQINALRQVAS